MNLKHAAPVWSLAFHTKTIFTRLRGHGAPGLRLSPRFPFPRTKRMELAHNARVMAEGVSVVLAILFVAAALAGIVEAIVGAFRERR